jgi:hypothetical protein
MTERGATMEGGVRRTLMLLVYGLMILAYAMAAFAGDGPTS